MRIREADILPLFVIADVLYVKMKQIQYRTYFYEEIITLIVSFNKFRCAILVREPTLRSQRGAQKL